MDKKYKNFTAQFFKHNRIPFIIAMLSMFLLALGNLIISWLMRLILDAASGQDIGYSLTDLLLITLGIIAGLVAAQALDYVSRPLFIKKAMKQYKDFAFAEMTKKSISSFSNEQTSTYITALSTDAATVEVSYVQKLFPLVNESIMFVGAFAMMIWYSPLLTLVAVIVSLLPVVASILTGNRMARCEKYVSDCNESFIAMLKDSLSGFSVIKSFKAEAEMIRMFSKSNDCAEGAKCARRKTEIVIQTIGMIAGTAAQFGVFLFGAYLALSGRGITAGVVIVFVQLMNYVITPIADVPQILANRKAAKALIKKLSDAIYSDTRREGIAADNKLTRSIDLNDVSFGYDENSEVLSGITISLKAGKSYAIVGGSGSGKSTLLSLLMGSYMSYSGDIYYDGKELKDISSESLYDIVSIVQQSVFVFNSSIINNITLFKKFDKEKIDKVIQMSGLSQLIEEKGEEYLCGENGNGLSGGERQRISIARCLLRDTPVLLVDEATASLDAAMAYSITDAILNIKDITRIVVTHRLEESLMSKYDDIVVLKNGKVHEIGTFKELMEQKGFFYSLFTVSQ